MLLYIDPGTGSMLFTVLIGVAGALIYALRNVLGKARFLFSGGAKARGKAAGREEIVFFTDSGRYWNIFKPLCDEMECRGQKVLYLTASPDDPLLKESYDHIRCEFAGEGNKAYARMNFIKADIVLSSTPGLDVYQWKRSRDVKWYAHIIHAPNDVTRYRMFGLDYFDAVLVSGEYQVGQIRGLEKVRELPEKEVVLVGLPQLDYMREKLLNNPSPEKDGVTVLLAPSWGPSSIFNRFGEKMIRTLTATGHHLIIRPHPQSMTSEKELIDRLQAQFPNGEGLEWNFDNDNFDVLNRADILISDFSGVMFDFALVFNKPIIYADVSFDKRPYDASWLEEEMWTLTVLDRIGKQLTPENAEHIGELIDECLNAPELAAGREQARQETWVNIGSSVQATADYLTEKEKALREESKTGPDK
ncbi:MAG: CDP-glycerol glycerophosphotransferase family protein [Clostridia bacterium]|nr:CDP-glycerol glycerophosphotransferase family protein [Clostridia bacterium]